MTENEKSPMKKIAAQMAKEYWLPALLAALWIVINRYVLQSSNPLPIASDFFITFLFLNFFTGNFFRIDRQTTDRSILTALKTGTDEIGAATDKIAASLPGIVAVGTQLAQLAKTNPILQPIAQNLATFSNDLSTQIGEIRTANTATSSFISDALPMTFAGTDAAGKPFSKDMHVRLATMPSQSNTPNPGPAIPVGTSEELKKKIETKPFSSIIRSE